MDAATGRRTALSGQPRLALARERRLICGWAVLAAVSTGLFLLPVGYPAERAVLLVCLGGLWAGALVAARRDRFPRLLVLAVAAVQFFPIRSGLTRAALLAGFALLWVALAYLNRERRPAIACLIAIPLLFAVFLMLPNRRVEPSALRREYVRSLLPYRGAVYIWGGENRIGIDCSGLIRCGWIDTNLRLGLRTANPGPVRAAIRTWLQDCSAQELGEGYRGRTEFVANVRALNRADYDLLAPGDIAVSDGGKHTLAYLGSETWIEAEPNCNGVKLVHVPAPGDVWF